MSNTNAASEITVPSSYVSSLGFGSNAAAVGKAVAIGITDATGSQSTVEATIVGVQQKSLLGSSTAFGNSALTNTLYDAQSTGLPPSTKGTYSTLSAVLKSGLGDAQVLALQNNLKAQGYSAKTVKDMVSTVFTAINAVTYVFDGFAAITLVAAAFASSTPCLCRFRNAPKKSG